MNTKFLISEHEKKKLCLCIKVNTAGLAALIYSFRRTYLSAWPLVTPKEFSPWNIPYNKVFLYVWSTKPACLGWFVQMMWFLGKHLLSFWGARVLVITAGHKQNVPTSSARNTSPRLRLQGCMRRKHCVCHCSSVLGEAAHALQCHTGGLRVPLPGRLLLCPFPLLILLCFFCCNKLQTWVSLL